MTDQVKLSREERTQLEDANAEALGKDIAELVEHFSEGRWDYRAFWAHSDRIHETFKKITPLKKSDRARLWDLFSDAREKVREKQDAERRYSQWLSDRRREAVRGYMEEMNEILAKPSKSDSDIEEIIFLQDALRLMTQEGWQGFPDTPDVAMAAFRTAGSQAGREAAEIKREIQKSRKKSSQFLEKGAQEKYAALEKEIAEIEDKGGRVSPARLKARLREVRKGVLSPILLGEQKERLLKRIEGMTGVPEAGQEEQAAETVSAAEKKPAAKARAEAGSARKAEKIAGGRNRKPGTEVEALLGEIEMSLSRKKE